MKTQPQTISAIFGAGSWGTAVAVHLARLGHPVYLWGRDKAKMQLLQRQRENSYYLPGITFPENLVMTSNIAEAMQMASIIVIATPSHAFRETLLMLKPYFTPAHRLVWITKGLDPHSHHLLHQVAEDIIGKDIPSAILSGPTFAKEVAAGLPTAVTLASQNKQVAEQLIAIFHSAYFRVYYSADIIGIQLGGAIKNVLAIAVGIADGLRCGANAQAALITRGLAEMIRLGTALGGQSETLMGLSGVGDLILTCTNNQSRNRRFGLAIGQGKSQHDAVHDIGQVVEGINTAAEVYQLAKQYHIEMPITEQVYQMLYQNLSPQHALHNLLSREPRAEY